MSSCSARRKEPALGLIAEITSLVTQNMNSHSINVKDLPLNDSLDYFLFLYSLEPRDIVLDHASRLKHSESRHQTSNRWASNFEGMSFSVEDKLIHSIIFHLEDIILRNRQHLLMTSTLPLENES